jgi:hypothetical protein
VLTFKILWRAMLTVAVGILLSLQFAKAQTGLWPNRKELLRLADSALEHYFGSADGDYSDPGTVVDQISGIIGGAPDPEVTLPDGRTFFSACRVQSCPEKAAEVVDLRTKRVFALGVIHFHIRPDGPKTEFGQRYTGFQEPILTIFVFRTPSRSPDDVLVTSAVERIKTWAQSVATTYGDNRPALKSIEIVDKFEVEPQASEK